MIAKLLDEFSSTQVPDDIIEKAHVLDAFYISQDIQMDIRKELPLKTTVLSRVVRG